MADLDALFLYWIAYTLITYAIGYHMGYIEGKSQQKTEQL